MITEMTVEEFEHQLKKLLARKIAENPRYSIRAFAKRLGLVDSTLQKILRGERKLGPRLASEIASKMNVRLVAPSSTKRKSRKKGWSIEIPSDSAAHVNWMNLAILEMLKLKSFVPEVSWIALRLRVSEETVETRLEEMESHGMLSRTGKRWIDLLEDASTGASRYRSTEEIRQMHMNVLNLSMSKLSLPLELRDHGFSILPLALKDLPKLKKKIQKFRWELCELAQNSKSQKDQVYAFQIGLFPLTEVSNG